MESKNKSFAAPLAFAVTIPPTTAPSESGEYVARTVKKKHNILIVPYTIKEIKNAAVRNQEEKKLAKVHFAFSPKSSPAKLSYTWVKKKQ